jgi:hypothetical protein
MVVNGSTARGESKDLGYFTRSEFWQGKFSRSGSPEVITGLDSYKAEGNKKPL